MKGFAAFAILLALAFGSLTGTGRGQTLASRDREPIVVEAEDGIEWIRDARKYVARGNARAVRGKVEVKADTLTAFYRDRPGGDGQEVFRVDADGDVRIASEGTQAFGDKGVYRVDEANLVLVGRALRLVSDRGTITARDSLEYWEKRALFVARGNATVVSEDKRLRADILTAHIVTAKDGTREIQRVDAFGNVHISTPTEIARADEGVYNLVTGIVTLKGNVKITRGTNQLNGDEAVVDLNTGISRMVGKTRRVRGLITPRR